MKRSLLLLAIVILASCEKEQDSPIGNTLFNWKLEKVRGPFNNFEWLEAKNIKELQDDGFRVTAQWVLIPNPYGGSQWGYKYTGSIYQGAKRYWPTKDDYSFPVQFLSDSTFKLGTDEQGFNLSTYDAWGEKLHMRAWFPNDGVEYVYQKTSD